MTYTLPGFTLNELLYLSKTTAIHRAIRESDHLPVILKTLIEEYPSSLMVAKLIHEKNILQNITQKIDDRYLDFIQHINFKTLVLHDHGDESLDIYASKNYPSLQQLLTIFINISENLNLIHQAGIIHKDIKPQNILIDSETLETRIIDFGIATQLPKEIQEIKSPNVLEGSLSYIAPEQTGRLNRSVDYRSDLYSLGVLMYELCAHQLPFESSDPMEFIYYHIAKIPRPPKEINTSLPKVLSDIIMKLLSKNAEDRYQSDYGLKFDLEKCLDQELAGIHEEFPIAQKDVSIKFQIPSKVYGRERELELLLNNFEKICQGYSRLVLITGYSGIGKSALVQEIHRPIVKNHGYFITGKFDQFQKEKPYHAFIQVFTQIAKQILTEDKQSLQTWKKNLLEALGQNGKVITEMVPEMELIIGSQPPLPTLGIQENQNRFILVLQNFIRSLASKEFPLTIFIDDLQWADLPSLNLLDTILSNQDIRYLLIIGAYRNNEVTVGHRLEQALSLMQTKGISINTISLLPLTLQVVTEIIADTLHTTLNEVVPLAHLCYEKTQGNPFFLDQFLLTLYQEKLIFANVQTGQWNWNLEEIKNKNVTDNVLELMIEKIKKFNSDTQELLELAACIGNTFDLQTLAIVYQKSPQETNETLWPVLQEGLILPTSENYKFAEIENISISYRFLHDRVQQAAHSLIEEERKKIISLKIARLLYKNPTFQNLNELIFNIVNHYNFAIDLITEPEEKYELVKLNLLAGKKAKSSNVYALAFEYLDLGTSLLEKNSWETDYQLTLELFVEKVEAAYLCNKYELIDESAAIILHHIHSPLDKIRVVSIKILKHAVKGDIKAAINEGIEYCHELGVNLPKETHFLGFLYQFTRTRLMLLHATVESIANLPMMTDPYKIAALRTCTMISASVYRYSPQLSLHITTICVQLSHKYGNSETSPFFYICQGLALCGVFRNIPAGYTLGQTAVKLLEILPHIKSIAPRVLFLFSYFIGHWKMHLKDVRVYSDLAVQKGLEVGDIEYVFYVILSDLSFDFFLGTPLDLLEKKIAEGLKFAEKFQQLSMWRAMITTYNPVLRLQNKVNCPPDIPENEFKLGNLLEIFTEEKTYMSANLIYLNQMMLHYLFYEYLEAFEYAKNGRPTVPVSFLSEPIFYYYDSLIRLAVYPKLSPQEQKESLSLIQKNQKLMAYWAQNAPMNHQHRYHLVEAERARLANKRALAVENYELAISCANENGYVRDEALALELAGAFYFKNNNTRTARAYLKGAIYAYSTWGATAKVEHLGKVYAELFSHLPDKSGPLTWGTEYSIQTITHQTSSEKLDVLSVMKSSQAISEEIDLNKLITKLLLIVRQNTGAERGLLLLIKEGNLYLEGETDLAEPSSVTLKSIPVESILDIPLTVLQYVERTREFLVIDNALTDEKFQKDPYIAAEHIKSILCIPIIHQQILVGILYCENSTSSHVFTTDRVNPLRLLSSQIAISIQNATLYSELNEVKKNLEQYNINLEHTVADRTSELNRKNIELHDAIKQLKMMQNQIIQQEKLAGLGLITQGLSHEIMNPLNFVKNFSDLSFDMSDEILGELQKPLPELNLDNLKTDMASLKENIKRVQQNGQRISEIVKSMQELVKVRGTEAIEKVDFHGMLSKIVKYIESELHSKHPFKLKIECDFEEALPLVPCFHSHLRRVLLNILDNSYYALLEKSKKPNHEDLCIKMTTKKINRTVQLSIWDNGIGISGGDLSKIFVPFFTTKPQGQGNVGLGLSIAYDIIVNEHGGQIRVDSELGRFTLVTITLPLIF